MLHDTILDEIIGPSLLLIEDNPDDLMLLQYLLGQMRGARFRIRTAGTLAEAVMEIGERPPNLILLDLNLPDSSGLVTLTRVWACAPGVAIVVLTGDAEDRLALAAVREGAQDFLQKGHVDAPGLARTLRYALERQRLVTELEHARAQEAHRATHDPLTDLPNRALFNDRLNHALARSTRHDYRLAVAYLDLDNFKPVNDRLGHAAGDRVLIEAVTRLRSAVRSSDTLARLGGDEFAVLFEQVPDQTMGTALAEALRARLNDPFEVAGERFVVGASLGVTFFPDDGRRADDLLRVADVRMYEDKRSRHARSQTRSSLRLA